MALIKCPECGNMISDKAAKCPKCGNSSISSIGVYNKTKKDKSLLLGLGTTVVFGGIGYGLGIALQNFNLFIVMLVVAMLAGIAAFFISRINVFRKSEANREHQQPPLQ